MQQIDPKFFKNSFDIWKKSPSSILFIVEY